MISAFLDVWIRLFEKDIAIGDQSRQTSQGPHHDLLSLRCMMAGGSVSLGAADQEWRMVIAEGVRRGAAERQSGTRRAARFAGLVPADRRLAFGSPRVLRERPARGSCER